MDATARHHRIARFEAALWIVMSILAFLAKGNPALVYPQALYLFLLLLASSLGTGLAIRLAPEKPWLHVITLLAGFAAIAGIQEWSGGTESSLWVLYLLPLFTAAILLDGRELAWTALGACASNAALYLSWLGNWNAIVSFELALKTGVLTCAATAIWLMSRAQREADSRARRQHEKIEKLEASARAEAETREHERGLTEIAAVGARAAHDLTTPLMVVRAYARLHLEQGVEDPVLARDLGRIESAAAFCQHLASSLMARPGNASTTHRLSNVVETALALAEPILRSRQVTVSTTVPSEPLYVTTPQQDLERILLNLLGNAAKAVAPGSKVHVTVIRTDTGSRPSVLIAVEDNGPGIPDAVLPKLFKPFTTTNGTGLGLHLSREAARRLGGDIQAENVPGGGARFVVCLPLTTAPKPATAQTAAV